MYKGKCGHKPYTIFSDNPKMDTSGMNSSKVMVVEVQSYEHGGEVKVPKKYKGFASLPEDVQEKINKEMAKKYKRGGYVYSDKNDPDTMLEMDEEEFTS